ncbi:aromatic-L-amino-acid/L-tryptophan decarboxylase [Paragonimus westermani]|uniref:Aromatic-L-amino-acid decarboxylase n=1 Tax=Paragonimus westermani TaxID=34504 RepID=A0A5J4NEN6_9TREM|nr:aromatic-L-amino-acid/L-tryptophan decarboxylase [Paragonimus westermani]
MTEPTEETITELVDNEDDPFCAHVLNHDEFRESGCDMVNYVANYLETIENRKVFPVISPGYMTPLLPKEAPKHPESWGEIMLDVERVIMPGASSPACTELEVVMMDWLAKMLRLPEHFLSGGNGGGVIQGSCSESTLVALFGARNLAIRKYQQRHPEASVYDAASKLVGYYSDQAHSSVERAGLISMLRLRPIRTGSTHELTGIDLKTAIEQDLSNGLMPFFVS